MVVAGGDNKSGGAWTEIPAAQGLSACRKAEPGMLPSTGPDSGRRERHPWPWRRLHPRASARRRSLAGSASSRRARMIVERVRQRRWRRSRRRPAALNARRARRGGRAYGRSKSLLFERHAFPLPRAPRWGRDTVRGSERADTCSPSGPRLRSRRPRCLCGRSRRALPEYMWTNTLSISP